MKEKVSPFWQCGMALFLPLGIWAFYRINKLRLGLLLYLVVGIIPNVIYGIGLGLSTTQNEANLAYVIYGVSWLVCIGFLLYGMGKWSEKWNETAPSIDMESRKRNLESSYPDKKIPI